MVGESLVDLVQTADGVTTTHAGGSGANTAVALSRLGRSVRLATCFAEDEYGALLARHLAEDGVALATDPATVDRTSSARAWIGADGAASYAFDLEWRLGPIFPTGPTPAAVHLTSLGAVLPPGCDDVLALVAGLRDRSTVTYDLNVRAEVTGTGPEVRGRVERLVALSDVIKASDEDLATLWPALSVEAAVGRLLSSGPAAVVVTRGGEGALFRTREYEGAVSAVHAEVVDTIGAGDTFSAAMLDALAARDLVGADRRAALRGAGPEVWRTVLSRATRAASVTVSRAGADPPSRDEVG